MSEDTFYYSEQFKKIANQQKVLLNKGTMEHGITYVQSLVILHLANMRERHGDDFEISQKEIESYLSLKGSTVTHILGRMEENGFIRREKSAKDSRANRIILTEKGSSIVPLFFRVLDDVENRMTTGMKAGEKELLKSLLERVVKNMEADK